MNFLGENTFNYIGDAVCVTAGLLLIHNILRNKNVTGLSYLTQQIFIVIVCIRYFDIFYIWKGLYILIIKMIVTFSIAYTVYLMKCKQPYCLSLDKQADSFPHFYLYLISIVAAILVHKSLSIHDFLWSCSIWLEALAILPQLNLIRKLKQIQNLTATYVLLLALHRIFYLVHIILHWEQVEWTSFLASIVQTLLFADFIYYYCKATQLKGIMTFPV